MAILEKPFVAEGVHSEARLLEGSLQCAASGMVHPASTDKAAEASAIDFDRPEVLSPNLPLCELKLDVTRLAGSIPVIERESPAEQILAYGQEHGNVVPLQYVDHEFWETSPIAA